MEIQDDCNHILVACTLLGTLFRPYNLAEEEASLSDGTQDYITAAQNSFNHSMLLS